MGASISSSHSSCPDHPGRLKRVDGNNIAGLQCVVCRHAVVVSARVRVHRCRELGCTFVLHDGCFRLPAKIKHFAHPRHRLALAAVAGGGHDCSLCAEKLVAHAYAYSCAAPAACSAGGFRAHPRCCNLPETMADAEVHPHGRLVLLPPSTGGGNNGRRRSCHKCAARRPARAWSYRCPDPECEHVEVCLKCVIGGNGDAAQSCCVHVEPGRIGDWIGTFLCGIGQGMGLPGFTTAQSAAPGS